MTMVPSVSPAVVALTCMVRRRWLQQMANQRRAGWVVRSYSVPAELHQAAKVEAERQGVSLSAVIREALRALVARHADE